jgi:trk system potassium uptake protein TrkA
VKVIGIGCCRVGSNVALQLHTSGWEVTCIDENEDALTRLGDNWTGGFLVGHGMDLQLLRDAGIEDADAGVVTTDGDNSNVVIGQAAQQRFQVPTVVIRLLDQGRAQFYGARDADRLPDLGGDRDAGRGGPRDRGCRGLMYVLIAGGGKVGANLTRSLQRTSNEVTLIEQSAWRYDKLEAEFEHQVIRGDATELFVLERAGIKRPPDLVVAATGDDEDNIVICQLAREKYGVQKVIARINDPRNQSYFDLISPTVSATASIMALIEHEVPEHGLIHLLELRKENLEIVELIVDKGSACDGKKVAAVRLPEGARLISVVRDGKAEIADQDTALQAGDQVLPARQSGKEDEPAPFSAHPGGAGDHVASSGAAHFLLCAAAVAAVTLVDRAAGASISA